MSNNDDEDSDKIMDWENQDVDTGVDVSDIAPLYLRKKPVGRAFPPGWKATLSVDKEKMIRIFDKYSAAGKEIIGKNKGKSFNITDLSPDEHRLGMEATQYPDAAFDGKVTLTLKLFNDKGTEVHSENAIVRASPWIMFNHAWQTTKVYVVETNDNATFRGDLSATVGVPVQAAPEADYGKDRWMQDVMEPGFSSLPKTGSADDRNLPVALRTANDRQQMGWGGDDAHGNPLPATDRYPKEKLLGPNYGFVQVDTPITGNSLDSFGNLECSPPLKHEGTGRDYKFGRIVYGGGGREMHLKVRQFLKAQKVQEPFEIDTDWLSVGHVDEVISLPPATDGPQGLQGDGRKPENGFGHCQGYAGYNPAVPRHQPYRRHYHCPYFLGLSLGDGRRHQGQCNFPGVAEYGSRKNRWYQGCVKSQSGFTGFRFHRLADLIP